MRIWDLAERTQVAEFAGHKFGVVCVVSFFLPFIKLAYCITQVPLLFYLPPLDASLSLVMCKKAGCVQLD